MKPGSMDREWTIEAVQGLVEEAAMELRSIGARVDAAYWGFSLPPDDDTCLEQREAHDAAATVIGRLESLRSNILKPAIDLLEHGVRELEGQRSCSDGSDGGASVT